MLMSKLQVLTNSVLFEANNSRGAKQKEKGASNSVIASNAVLEKDWLGRKPTNPFANYGKSRGQYMAFSRTSKHRDAVLDNACFFREVNTIAFA